MSVIMGVDVDNTSSEEQVEQVMQRMWRYNSTYTVNSGENSTIESQMPVWFIPDEVGCALTHSDDPNFRIVPFIHLPEQITYSILFPVRDIEEGEFASRDFVENLSEPGSKRREALLVPWQYKDFSADDFSQTEPDDKYFQAGRIEETLPDADSQQPPEIDLNRPLRVYSEYEYINKFLTDPAFELVDNEEQADVLWYMAHFKNFKDLSDNSPNKFVNQFPFENVLTVKDLLSCICRRSVEEGKQFNQETLEAVPNWLPITFNLNMEMAKFVSYFQNREEKELDNYWIIKPWNLARGLDMQITDNLTHILRLPTTGPKIAQKYVENPVLFQRNDIVNGSSVKFDVRYVILLKSAAPLEAYVYKNFFLRFSNKEFSLDHFDDYEKHFTVMNYTETAQLKHLPCADFLEEWPKQFGEHPWDGVEQKICEMLKEILENAVKKGPPKGLAPNLQSRALYAADIILEWTKGKEEVQPKILEINWMPDCARACNYYPEFYNDIFKLLFLGQPNADVFRKL